MNNGFAQGGYVRTPDIKLTLARYDRGWWKCARCGQLFEAYETPPKHVCANAPAASELHAWRAIGAQLQDVLNRILASAGDSPAAEIVRLQHQLTDLLNRPNT